MSDPLRSEINDVSSQEQDTVSLFSPRLYGIAILVFAIILTGIFFISKFTQMDLSRDMQTWQEKLSLIAESRSKELNEWIDRHFSELHALSDNPALQLYLSELQSLSENSKNADQSEEPAQKTYLRNLIMFTAERSGYLSSSVSSSLIGANIQESNESGLAVLDAQHRIVVSTATSAAIREKIIFNAKLSQPGRDSFIDISRHENRLLVGFSVPIFSIQGDRDAQAQIGRVVGIKVIDAAFFSLLKHPGVTERTLETVLMRLQQNNQIEYVSPLMDGSEPLSKQLQDTPGRYAEFALMTTIGGFFDKRDDYRGVPVLATSRAISQTPWVMLVKIDRKEALAESDQRRASMIAFFFFIIAIIVLIILAVWWHAHSKRAMMMSYHFKKIAAEAKAQESLLRLVADHQPEPIFILDSHHRFQFANKQAADEAEMSPENLIGKTINDVRGSARSERLIASCEKAASQQASMYAIQQVVEGEQERVLRCAFVPLAHIPIAHLPNPSPGVLVVEQDISDVVHEREQRIQTHHQLIQTLIRLVDKRDPHAADHSMMVSHLACEVAIEMGLAASMVEATKMAASLMNIGKIIVPQELLTKTQPLSEDERRLIQDSIMMAADIVRDVRFDGPVIETLRQWQERWNGSGPLGISGDSILISARIIAVANAFIGMISPRSWRHATPIAEASRFLMNESGAAFDQRVVVALINYVENHHGAAWLTRIIEGRRNVA